MIDFALKYQAVIFAPLEDITPSPDTLKYFIDEFQDKELIPSMFQEITPSGVKNRFILKSTDDEWNIEFSLNRLDIMKVNRDIFVSKFGTKEEFIDDVLNILKVVFLKFPRKANRISFVTQYFCKSFEDEMLNKIALNLANLPETFKHFPPINWNHRYVSRILKEINGIDELMNFIGEINRVQGNLKIKSKIEEFDRIELKFDINTYQGNQDYRFNLGNFEEFYSKVVKWEDNLLNEFLSKVES